MQNIKCAIASKINDNMLRLSHLQQQISALQAELEQFMVQYFNHISKHLTHNLPQNLLKDSKQPESQPTTQQYANNFEAILKQLYRTLAKHFHPDCNNNNTNEVNMQRINEAYGNKQLGSLLLISAELNVADEILKYSVTDLLHYHELVQLSITIAQQELEQLQQSDAMRLKHNILLARLQGYDMMSSVAAKLQRKYQLKECAA